MKKLAFIILFIFPTFVQSQEFAPLGAKWYYSHTQPYNGSLMTRMESIGVTEINEKECKILETKHFYEHMNPDETLVLDSAIWSTDYYYKENDKIYHYDPFADDFEVLYDFNVIAGDTITVRDTVFEGCDDWTVYPPWYYCSSFMYAVDSIDNITVDGYQLKRIHNHSFWRFLEERDWGFSFEEVPRHTIQDIGSTGYWFGRSIIMGIEGMVSDLRCYEDENMFYRSASWPEPYPCDSIPGFIITSMENFTYNINIKSFPNPFTTSTSIEYTLDHPSDITLAIFNHLGKLVDLIRQNQPSGKQQITWNADGLPAGIYFYTLKVGDQAATGKLIKM